MKRLCLGCAVTVGALALVLLVKWAWRDQPLFDEDDWGGWR